MANTVIYVLKTDDYGNHDKYYSKYRDAHNEAKRMAQDKSNDEYYAGKEKKIIVHRNDVSLRVTDPRTGGWWKPFSANIIKRELL